MRETTTKATGELEPETRRRLAAPLSAYRSRDRLRRLVESGAGPILVIGLLLHALASVEQLLDPGLGLRGALGGTAALLLVLALARALAVLADEPDDLAVAWRLERAFPGRTLARLATAVEHAEGRLDPRADPELVAACARQAAEALADADPGGVVDWGRAGRLAGLAALVLAAAGLRFGPDPRGPLQLLARFLGPGLGIELPAPVRFEVEPGSTRVLAGTRFVARVRRIGERGGELVAIREGASGLTDRLALGAGQAAEADFGPVHEDFRYRFEAGPYRSSSHAVLVVTAPKPVEVSLRYEYPAYAGLPERRQRGGDLDVSAPRGSRVHLSVKASRPLASAGLRLVERDTGVETRIPGNLTAAGRSFTATLPVEISGTWQMLLEDRDGFADPAPPKHRLRAEGDPAPKVFVLDPGKDLERAPGPGPRLPVALHATDNFGVAELVLEWTVTQRRKFAERQESGEVPVPLAGSPAAVQTTALLDLSGLPLEPGDSVSYRARARDARPEGGDAAVGHSHTYRIEVPVPRQAQAEHAEAGAEQQQELQEILDAQKDWEARLDRTLRDMGADGEISWKERRELESLLQQEKEIRRQTRELSAEMKQSLEEARRQSLNDPEVQKRLEQVQELLQKVADERMHQLVEELRDLMSRVQVDPGELKELRKRYEKESQADSLERMVEALKKLKVQQEVERARQEIGAIAKDQEALRDQVTETLTEPGKPEPEKAAGLEALAAPQEELAARVERALQDLEGVEKDLAEEDAEAARRIQDARDALREGDSAQKKMEEARKSLQQKQGNQAQKSASDAAQKLRQAEEALKQAGRDLEQKRRSINLQKVVKMVRLGLEVSDRQERVVAESMPDSPDPRAICRRLAVAQDTLFRGASRFETEFDDALQDELELKESFMTAVAELVENLRDAKVAFEQVRPFTGRQLAGTGLVKLNQILAKLLDVQEEMQDGMSSGSMDQFMQDLQEMIEKQKKLNELTQRLPKDPGQEELLRQMMEQLGREQGEMAQKARELEEKSKGMEGKQGDLGEVSKDMDKVAEALRQMETAEATRERQQRIVTRMLDMATSMQKQGESKQREAEAARSQAAAAPPPPPPDLAETRRHFFENREKEGYPLEDREAVEGYLDSLTGGAEPAPATKDPFGPGALDLGLPGLDP